jgi:hypothetical protein
MLYKITRLAREEQTRGALDPLWKSFRSYPGGPWTRRLCQIRPGILSCAAPPPAKKNVKCLGNYINRLSHKTEMG